MLVTLSVVIVRKNQNAIRNFLKLSYFLQFTKARSNFGSL